MGYREKYDEWLTSTYFDADTKAELKEIESNEKEIEDRFIRIWNLVPQDSEV